MLEGGDLDVLTGDYLAELTMLILGRQRLQGTEPRIRGHVPASDGGMPRYRARARRHHRHAMPEGSTRPGSPPRSTISPSGSGSTLAWRGSRETMSPREPRNSASGSPLAANAYLGAWGIAACIASGADVVVTGRVTDASLVVGPAAASLRMAARRLGCARRRDRRRPHSRMRRAGDRWQLQLLHRARRAPSRFPHRGDARRRLERHHQASGHRVGQ